MVKDNLNHSGTLFVQLLANRVYIASLSVVNISSCRLLFVRSLIRRFPFIIFPLCFSRFALAIPDSEEKHLFPCVTLSFSSSSSHLSLSPHPFLPLHPSFLSFSFFVPRSVQPRVAIETDLFEIKGKENYFSLVSTPPPPLHSFPGRRFSSSAGFIELDFNIIYLRESHSGLLLPWLLWEH